MVLDGSAAGAQQQIRVSIFVHDQQAAGALVHHAVDAVQQAVLLGQILKRSGVANHHADRAVGGIAQLLLQRFKHSIQIIGCRRVLRCSTLQQPHKGSAFRHQGFKHQLRELRGQDVIRQHQALQMLRCLGCGIFAQNHGHGAGGVQRHLQIGQAMLDLLPAAAATHKTFQRSALQKALHAGITALHFALLQLGACFGCALGDLLIDLVQYHLVAFHFEQIPMVQRRFGRLMDKLEIIKATQKHEMDVRPQHFRFPLQSQAVHIRHADVRQHHIHLVVLQNG